MSVYRHLGVWKHGDVITVRFGEHRILDETTVRMLGDELYAVADRSDCHFLLLNFAGVVALSSLMVGKLLMLQRKMVSKGGKLKLCELGPELQDLVGGTKLDQIFDIWDSEPEALRAFSFGGAAKAPAVNGQH
jgi:anti-sigma B factor antagonist